MFKGTNKPIAVLLFLLFIGGTILLPAFHRAHCGENHGSHETGTCLVCQFVNTPAITTSSAIVPNAESVPDEKTVNLPVAVPASLLRAPTQARAPPVA